MRWIVIWFDFVHFKYSSDFQCGQIRLAKCNTWRGRQSSEKYENGSNFGGQIHERSDALLPKSHAPSRDWLGQPASLLVPGGPSGRGRGPKGGLFEPKHRHEMDTPTTGLPNPRQYLSRRLLHFWDSKSSSPAFPTYSGSRAFRREMV